MTFPRCVPILYESKHICIAREYDVGGLLGGLLITRQNRYLSADPLSTCQVIVSVAKLRLRYIGWSAPRLVLSLYLS